jgi:superfamily I DNA/RNA helicase
MNQVIDPLGSEMQQDEARQTWYSFIRRHRGIARALGNENRTFGTVWEDVESFLNFLGKPALVGLSADYERGRRLEELIDATKGKVSELYEIHGSVVGALSLLGEQHAVRLMTAHKCKGLEFENVIVLAVEEETYWGDETASRCEYFVAISRAKSVLVLTTATRRERPEGAQRWRVNRTPQEEFLGFARNYLT